MPMTTCCRSILHACLRNQEYCTYLRNWKNYIGKGFEVSAFENLEVEDET